MLVILKKTVWNDETARARNESIETHASSPGPVPKKYHPLSQLKQNFRDYKFKDGSEVETVVTRWVEIRAADSKKYNSPPIVVINVPISAGST